MAGKNSFSTDVVVPDGNEEKLIKKAEELNYKRLILLYNREKRIDERKKELQKKADVELEFACKVKKTREKPSGYDSCFARCERKFLEEKRVRYLFNAETHPKEDYEHHRNSGLNQVRCKLAKENKKTFVFNLNNLRKQNLESDVILGRMMQNARFINKYGNDWLMASFAEKSLEMANPEDIKSLARVIGLVD